MDDIKEQILGRWRHYNRKRYSDDKTLEKILEDVPNASQEMIESVIFSQILTGESLLKILKKHPSMSILDIANEFNVAPKVVEDEVDKLREYGINVDVQGYNVELSDKIQPPEPSLIDPKDFFRSVGDTNRIAVIADTHLCSKYERLDALNAFLDVCVDEKIKDVYICGNMIDGETNFNKFDVKTKGFESQIEYFINNYPHKKSLTTHILTGDDHEGWYVQREHINVGKFLELKAKDMGRDDIKYIGHMEKDFIFSQNHRNKQSVRFIHAGGGCFAEGAEILTRDRGWVDFKDLTLEDYVATKNKVSGIFEWEKPEYITNEPYRGKMYQFTSRTFDFTVTPNHGLWVRNYRSVFTAKQPKIMPQKGHNKKTLDWYRIDAKNLYDSCGRQQFQMSTTVNGWTSDCEVTTVDIPRLEPQQKTNKRNIEQMQHVGTQKIEDIAELIGWYVTEGSLGKKKITISQYRDVNPENHQKIVDLIARMGLRCYVTDRSISIHSVELCQWIYNQCDKGSYCKFIPTWLKNQNEKVLRILFDTMIAGDGWKRNTNSFGYKSFSRKLLSDMSEIAVKLGYGVTHNSKSNSISIRSAQNEPTINKKPIESDYNGNIYCCTVPNGLIYVRMNGKAFWSHNSSYATSYSSQKYVESLQSGEKPRIVFVGHFHKYDVNYPREVFMVQVGAFQDQTPFMRKKRIHSQIGGIIAEFHTCNGIINRFKHEFIPFYNKEFYYWDKEQKGEL